MGQNKHVSSPCTEANRGALAGLLEARAEVAGLLGFQSHAHYTTAPLLAGHPDAVRRLLGDMSARAMDSAGQGGGTSISPFTHIRFFHADHVQKQKNLHVSST